MRSELRREMSKAIRKRMQALQVSGNWSGILFHLYTKKPKFEIDLRVEGVPQDAILQDEEQMKEMTKKLVKLKSGSCTKSSRDDLKKKSHMIFIEESSGLLFDMFNLELIELRQTSATIQFRSCLKHIPEGLNMCPCGVRLRPNQDTMNQSKARFEALITPYYRAKLHSRGKRHGHNLWQKDNAKAMGVMRGAKKRGDHPSILSRLAERRHIPSFSGGYRVD